MTHGTRTVYPGKRNKGLSLTFQPPEEGRSVQQPKCCDKLGDKDEDNSPRNVNNVYESRLTFTQVIILIDWNLNVIGTTISSINKWFYDHKPKVNLCTSSFL